MHDLFAHIDRRTERLQRNANDIDRANNSRTETSGFEKKNSLGLGSAAGVSYGSMVKGSGRHLFSITCLCVH
jgi:hypothetical protein